MAIARLARHAVLARGDGRVIDARGIDGDAIPENQPAAGIERNRPSRTEPDSHLERAIHGPIRGCGDGPGGVRKGRKPGAPEVFESSGGALGQRNRTEPRRDEEERSAG
jgi:hypothetical protein